MLLIYFREDDVQAKAAAQQLLPEGKSQPIDKAWSVRRERSHHDPTTFHNHVQFRGRDISIINDNGTQSHHTTRDGLPNWVVDWLVDNQYIKESADFLPRQAIDPVVAEKVRRIAQFGIAHELDHVPSVFETLKRWFRR